MVETEWEIFAQNLQFSSSFRGGGGGGEEVTTIQRTEVMLFRHVSLASIICRILNKTLKESHHQLLSLTFEGNKILTPPHTKTFALKYGFINQHGYYLYAFPIYVCIRKWKTQKSRAMFACFLDCINQYCYKNFFRSNTIK